MRAEAVKVWIRTEYVDSRRILRWLRCVGGVVMVECVLCIAQELYAGMRRGELKKVLNTSAVWTVGST